MKTYKPKLIYLLPILLVPIILVGGLLLSGELVDLNLIIGFLLFMLAAFIPVFIVIGNKVVINDENGTVLAYLFGIKILELTSSSVLDVSDGYLFPIIPGGGGFGRGIIVRAKYKGSPRIFRMGISLYGEEAVNHVKEILKSK